jgi:hypothetical protein
MEEEEEEEVVVIAGTNYLFDNDTNYPHHY